MTEAGPNRAEELLQRDHYDAIADAYEMHYADHFSLLYTRDFFLKPMLEGMDLNGLHVLDAMCGSGPSVGYLLSRGAKVSGLDISPRVMADFRRKWPECEAIVASIFDSTIEDESFDCVCVTGGLHHLHPHLDEAVDQIFRILRPGGYFCFCEPYAGSLPDYARKLWYRFDPLFESNEKGVDVERLEANNSARFEVIKREYMGGIAYLLVLNSLVFRIPVGLKKYYAPPAFRIEAFCNRFVGKRTAFYVTAQWRKRE